MIKYSHVLRWMTLLCDTLGNFSEVSSYEAKSVDLIVSGYFCRYSWDWRSTSSKAALDPDMHCSGTATLLLLQPETLASLGGNKSEPSSGVSVLESAFEVYTSPLIEQTRK